MVKTRNLLIVINFIIAFSLLGCSYGNAIHTHERLEGYVLHVPASKLSLTIPRNGFVQKDIRQGGGTDNPRYFFFQDVQRGIIISGWFEPETSFLGVKKVFEKTRTTYIKKGYSPLDVVFENIDNWEVTIFDFNIPDFTNSHVNAHWRQSGTWIDLHLSITTKIPRSEARSNLISLLKAIKVAEY